MTKDTDVYLFGENHYGTSCRRVLEDCLSDKEPDCVFIEAESIEEHARQLELVEKYNNILVSSIVYTWIALTNPLKDAYKNREWRALIKSSLLSPFIFPILLITSFAQLKRFLDGNESAICYCIKNFDNLHCIDSQEVVTEDASFLQILLAFIIFPIFTLLKNSDSGLYEGDKTMEELSKQSNDFTKTKERDNIMSEKILEQLNENKNYKNVFVVTGAAHVYGIKQNLEKAGLTVHTPGI